MADIPTLARALVETCTTRGLMIATAESCTGGLIAGAITEIAGSSAVFDRGFVTYSNEAKQEMLGVPAELIAAHGAVSEQVARAMAIGVLERSNADIAISVTGIAGPGGGSADKPVGTVWFGLAVRGGDIRSETHLFTGDRAAVRQASVRFALERLASTIT